MRLFVTGATGFVGREIVKQATAAGCQVRILARHADARPTRDLVSRYKVEMQAGDVTNAPSLRGALEGVDAVIHLVGIISEAGTSTFEAIHCAGTENIVRAAIDQRVKRLVQMSSLGTRPDAASRYHRSKLIAEETVRNSKLDWTIFRPSLIYGPEDKFVNLFAKIIRYSPVVPIMGRRTALFQPVPVENVAGAFVKSLSEPRAVGSTYDLCGEERLTMDEILDVIMSVLGKRRLKIAIPAALARLQARILELIFAGLLRRPPPLNRDQLIMLQEDNVGDPAAAKALFALPPERFVVGIARYLRPTTA
jgi:NADH dehydrogenase